MRILTGGDPNGELARKRGLDVLEVSDGANPDEVRRRVREALPGYMGMVNAREIAREIAEFRHEPRLLEHPAVKQRREAADLTERNRRENGKKGKA